MSSTFAPSVVAFLRGLVYAVILGGISFAIEAAGSLNATDLAPYVPLLVLFLRALEGLVLDRKEPNRTGVLGGHSDAISPR